MKYAIYFISCLLFALLTACAVPDIARRSVLVDSMPKKYYYAEVGRKCDITLGNINDKRPINEVSQLNQKNIIYLVPTFIWNQWTSAGMVFSDPKYYDENLIGGLQSALKSLIEKSNICSGEGTKYVVDVDLLHLYGAEYSKGFYVVAYGAALFEEHNFFPTGYASFSISVKDQSTGKIIDSKVINDSFLFNQFDQSLSSEHSAMGGTTNRRDNHVQVAMIALRRLLTRLPLLVEDIVAGAAPLEKAGLVQGTNFDLLRITKEYDFVERMNVDTETGKILNDSIVFREFPVISKPDEWIVSPFNKDGSWMSRVDYQLLLSQLSQKYSIEFRSNLNAATFVGAK